MTINNPDLFQKAIDQVYDLQKSLSDIKKTNPHLTDKELSYHWEFWTTDEILEIIYNELNDLLHSHHMDKRSFHYFSDYEKDAICFTIGEWYLKWKNKITDYDTRTHRLGFAKEELKDMICAIKFPDKT